MDLSDKKRLSDELGRSDIGLQEENRRLAHENDQLKRKLVDYESLKAKLAKYEDEDDLSDDDEDDEDSVCDDSAFSKKYIILKQYKQENGDCKVPQKHPDLGTWVMNTRAAFKKKKLPQDQIDKLNKIGFYWGKGHPEPPSWDDRFAELKKNKDIFGNCRVPMASDPSLMTELAKWVAEQRKQGKRLQKMKASIMTLDQYKLLNDIGFQWKVKKTHRS